MKSVDEIDSLLQSAKTSEKDSSEQIVPPNDEIEDGFYLIDDSNHDEDLDFSDFPWLDPDHPLFFPVNTGK